MITERQLRTIKLIERNIIKFKGNINDYYQVSNFIDKYLPLFKQKCNSLIKNNKRERYIIKNYSKW